MKWEKLGIVYSPKSNKTWYKHSVTTPAPLVMEDKIRVFRGFIDELGISQVGYVDLNKKNPAQVRGVSESPVPDFGFGLAKLKKL
jgi:hypothetical protein